MPKKLKPIMVLYTDGTFEEMLNRTVFKRYPGIEIDTDYDGCVLLYEGVEQTKTMVTLTEFEERAVVWAVDLQQDPPRIMAGGDTPLPEVSAHQLFKGKRL